MIMKKLRWFFWPPVDQYYGYHCSNYDYIEDALCFKLVFHLVLDYSGLGIKANSHSSLGVNNPSKKPDWLYSNPQTDRRLYSIGICIGYVDLNGNCSGKSLKNWIKLGVRPWFPVEIFPCCVQKDPESAWRFDNSPFIITIVSHQSPLVIPWLAMNHHYSPCSMVLEYESQHLPQKTPSHVGNKYIIHWADGFFHHDWLVVSNIFDFP